MSSDVAELLFFGDLHNEFKVLSMDYPCLIDYKDLEFYSVLHLFLYLRYENNNYDDLKQKILLINNLEELKLLTLNLDDYKIEDMVAEDMLNMNKALELRVSQDELANRTLLESKNRDLLYVTNNVLLDNGFWSYKYNVSGLDMYMDGDDDFVSGQNVYGKMLKTIRVLAKSGVLKNRKT